MSGNVLPIRREDGAVVRHSRFPFDLVYSFLFGFVVATIALSFLAFWLIVIGVIRV